MRTFLSEFLLQLKGIWGRLDSGQRFVVSSVLLATIAGLGAMVWYAGRPSYEVVYTATTGEDISTVRRALDQSSVAYIVDTDGMTFLVDRGRVGMAKAAIRESGVMTQSGSNALSASSIIDDAETKSWKLALASIARAENAVAQIEGVHGVTITASPARKTRAFVDRDKESRPTAAVLLKLRPGTGFESVARIAGMQTSAQLGLPRENITVSNASGGQSWRYDPEREAGGGSSEFLNTQRSMSNERTRRAQEVLDQMWPGKTSVIVNVELDAAWEVVSEKVLPKEALKKSEKTTSESTDTNSGSAAARTASSSTAASAPESTPSKSLKKNETIDREFVTEIGERRSGKLAPEVKRLSVAVVYDRSLEQAPGFSKEDLTSTVKAMVGWDKDRDSTESFSLQSGDMAPIQLDVAMNTGPGFADVALQWGPTIGQVLGVIVVVLFLRGLFKRSTKRAGGTGVVGEVAAEKPVNPEEMQRRMRKEIERAITSDPAALAKLLETWLIEQRA